MDMNKLAQCAAGPKVRFEATPGRGDLRLKTDQELLEEIDFWVQEIRNATCWGAGLAAADEFWRAAVREWEYRQRAAAQAGGAPAGTFL